MGSRHGHRSRWHKPRDRAEAFAKSQAAADDFRRAALKLFTGFRPFGEWSEAERLALRLVTDIQLLFQGGDADEAVDLLRSAVEVFRRTPGLERRRAWCVRAVSEWGSRWKLAEASTTRKQLILTELSRELAVHDDAFEPLSKDPDGLAAKLDAFEAQSSGKAGAKGAEAILAELIVEDYCGALGLAPKDSESDTDAVERIRAMLAKAADRYLSALDPAEKPPD